MKNSMFRFGFAAQLATLTYLAVQRPALADPKQLTQTEANQGNSSSAADTQKRVITPLPWIKELPMKKETIAAAYATEAAPDKQVRLLAALGVLKHYLYSRCGRIPA